jgi:hypothetical protein
VIQNFPLFAPIFEWMANGIGQVVLAWPECAKGKVNSHRKRQGRGRRSRVKLGANRNWMEGKDKYTSKRNNYNYTGSIAFYLPPPAPAAGDRHILGCCNARINKKEEGGEGEGEDDQSQPMPRPTKGAANSLLGR